MKKKMLTMAAALMAATAMTGVSSAFAAEGTKDVPVTYDNRNIIPDPDNPDNAEWGVVVPTAIVFTETVKERDADVELVGMNGHTITELSDDFAATVKVKSKNGMLLQLTDGSDQVSYTLDYEGTGVTGKTDVDIASLTKADALKTGKAKLAGEATKLGDHTDTLTYTVTGNGK